MTQFSLKTYQCTFFIVLSTILGAVSWGARSSEQPINFYLPSSSAHHGELVAELEQTLNNLLNRQIKVHHADNWNGYLDRMNKGQAGVYLAAPHFTAWLIHSHDFSTLSRFTEPLSYTVLSNSADFGVFELTDLQGRRLCTQAPLNLDFLMARDFFSESADPPTIAFTRSIERRLIENDARCTGFTASEALATRLESAAPNQYSRLALSKRWSNYAISASPDFQYPVLTQLKVAFRARPVAKLLARILNNEVGDPVLVKALRIEYPEELRMMLSPYWGS